MNLKQLTIVSLLSISICSCASSNCNKEKDTCSEKKTSITKSDESIIEGTVLEAGITTYQYGTHILKNGDKILAIRSTNIVLSNYKGKTLKFVAKKVSGYPVSGGPDYYEIIKITE